MRKAKILSVLLGGILIASTLAGCQSSESSAALKRPEETSDVQGEEDTNLSVGLSRADLTAQLEEIEPKYKQNLDDEAVALQYAQTLFSLGDFEPAQNVLKPLLKETNPSGEAVYLEAQIQYLNGNYKRAEEQYRYLAQNHQEDYGVAADAGLLMVYYQTNEYSKTRQLFAGQDFENPLLDMMQGFGDTVPYQIDWSGNEQTTIPFVTTEPLPVVPIEINGVKMNALIDNGASSITLDEAMSEELGVDTFSSGEGGVAGGSIGFSFGKTDSMKLGDVNIHNVPVTLISFEGISELFEGYATDVHAVISMNLLQQFKSVIDYPSGRLILFPRNESGEIQLNEMLKNDTVLDEIPFTLAGTHLMFAKGAINGHTGLNFFVDCGGSSDKDISTWVYKNTMDYLKIPIPEMVPASDVGGDFEEGLFNASYGVGKLQVEDGVCSYDTSGHSDDLSDDTGFVNDAMISHHYLKNYKWVIDFDTMTMTFC